jgi:pentatricopeptide repeat protein
MTTKQYPASQIVFSLIKIRQFALARDLFDEMLESSVRVNEYVYNAGIRAYYESGNLDGARG